MFEWRLKPFLGVVIALQIVLLGLVFLAAGGFDIPVLRQIIGFVYLTFIPGLLILRILRLHRRGAVETLLYGVGISLALVMFLGFFINLLYPVLGISRPISVLPLTITLAVVVFGLCVLAYLRERGGAEADPGQSTVSWREIFSPPVLFLLLLPLLSVTGAYLVNLHQNSVVLLVLIVLIALVAVLVAFNRFIPARLYPLALIMVALALVWHWSLISKYLTGWDIHTEYYVQSMVLAQSYWDQSFYASVNAMLSITMLPPAYSLVLNTDSVYVFKIIYPLLFSLLPLALFQIFRKQTGDRIAFFAAFFFASFYTYFTEMLGNARQEVAEIFLALSVLVILDNKLAKAKRILLLIIFSFSVVVSHYGTSYFYVFYLIFAFLVLTISKSESLGKIWSRLTSKFGGRGEAKNLPPGPWGGPTSGVFNGGFVILFMVFCFAWYTYLAAGSSLGTIVYVGNDLYQGLVEFFSRASRESEALMGVGLSSPSVTSLPRHIYLGLQYATELFIIVGVTAMVVSRRKLREFHPVFIAMTLGSVFILFLCIVLPYFSNFFNISRIYHLTLFFLAPFIILGGVAVFRWLYHLNPFKKLPSPGESTYLSLLVVVILVPYSLFSTGFIYKLTADPSISIALGLESDYPIFNDMEIAGKDWVLVYNGSGRIMADELGVPLLRESFYWKQLVMFYGKTEEVPDDTCLYLRGKNALEGVVKEDFGESSRYVKLADSPFGKKVLANLNKIYDNGGAQVYK